MADEPMTTTTPAGAAAPADPLADEPTPKSAGQPPTAADAAYKLTLALISAGKLPTDAAGPAQVAWDVALTYSALMRYFATGDLPASPEELGEIAARDRKAKVEVLAAAKLAAASAAPTAPAAAGRGGAPRHQ